jgi:hypothetical protein
MWCLLAVSVVGLLAFAGCVWSGGASPGGPSGSPAGPKNLDVRSLAQAGDTYEAIARIESQPDPLAVARTYAAVAQFCYGDAKDLTRSTAFCRAGLQYCLTRANAVAGTDPDLAAKLRRGAMSLSYNLAANSWPGWDEAGIKITASDIAIGMDAARCHFRLAKELEVDHKMMLNCYWLVGAMQLAARQHDEAVASFRQAEGEAALANDPEARLMAGGFVAVTQIVAARDADKARQQLKQVVAELTKIGSQDAKVYLPQFEAALRVFAAGGAGN